ncbi:MAG: LLM class flavin-dependent oxidoreductase [Gemmataceae bacterium]|nr:LLM class flavin-dependent oxidoreductase [Gemmataceae bacterium]MDW8267294.1 LLM class flavin-dependent oxidoreductase [Gemmataceae bacterium]
MTTTGHGQPQFFFFHLMPWPYLPANFADTHDSAWVWVPNALYDPVKGHDLYREYLQTLAYAEELGFDGICVNEHHQNAYGLMPSPNVIAGALTQRTRRVKIAVIGNALPLYHPPLRVAEEFAMLDVLSNGRLIAGMVIGGGPEFYSYNVDPTRARERFREALDLIVAAWTRPGPFPWRSKHYFYRYVNPWPRPIQQPHPPIWIPGVGSLETIDFVAQRRYAYMGIPYFTLDVFRRVFGLFREACERAGYTARPEQMGWGIPIYVAETDRQAREEFEPHLWYFVRNLLKGIGLTPPGYTSARSALAILKNQGSFLAAQKTWADIEKGGFALVGSPTTVRQQLSAYQKELGAGVILTGCQTGTLPHQLARKSMELLAREVLPHVRAAA